MPQTDSVLVCDFGKRTVSWAALINGTLYNLSRESTLKGAANTVRTALNTK